MKGIFANAVGISKEICKLKLDEGDIVVDATMGNGNDTIFLCELVGDEGKVYAFDIQESAIMKTKEKLINLNFENRVKIIHDGHENIDKYIHEEVKLIIFNLGYLPSGDHSITTKSKTTLESIKKGIDILKEGGIILLVIYPGHESGKQEKLELEYFTRNLDQKLFNVVSMKITNQINNPPEILCIEKLQNA